MKEKLDKAVENARMISEFSQMTQEELYMYKENNRGLKTMIKLYQNTYHDIDMSEIHKKLSKLTTENLLMARRNARLKERYRAMRDYHSQLKKRLSIFAQMPLFAEVPTQPGNHRTL